MARDDSVVLFPAPLLTALVLSFTLFLPATFHPGG